MKDVSRELEVLACRVMLPNHFLNRLRVEGYKAVISSKDLYKYYRDFYLYEWKQAERILKKGIERFI